MVEIHVGKWHDIHSPFKAPLNSIHLGSPVKMFLSSRQAGYSNRQQRPKDLHAWGSGGMLPMKMFEKIGFKW